MPKRPFCHEGFSNSQFTLYSPDILTSGIVEAVLVFSPYEPPQIKQMKPSTPRISQPKFTLYSPDKSSRGIVEAVLRITDDGPPVKPGNVKSVNAADKFYKEHQKDSESISQSSDKMRQVEEHNNAYPKLRDELDKRKDITKPNINTNQRLCNSSKRLNNPNKSNHYRHLNDKASDRHVIEKIGDRHRNKKTIEKYARMTKNKRKRQRRREACVSRNGLCLRNMTTQTKRKLVHTASSALEVALRLGQNLSQHYPPRTLEPINDPVPLHDINTPNRKTSTHSKSSKSEVKRLPSKSNPSVTSYHSFLSENHEPMVS